MLQCCVLHVQTLVANGITLQEGDWISLNGSTGEVVLGKQPLAPPAISGDLGTFMSWVDEWRGLRVRNLIFTCSLQLGQCIHRCMEKAGVYIYM